MSSVITRYRCAACGNLTRFDVTTTRRTRAFHHYSLSGDLSVEDPEVLNEVVEEVSCRWCGSGRAVEPLPGTELGPERPSERSDGPERPSERSDGPERPSERSDGPERPSERSDRPESDQAGDGPERPSERSDGPERPSERSDGAPAEPSGG